MPFVKETTRKGVMGDLRHLSIALANNAADLVHMDGGIDIFQGLVSQVQDIFNRQTALIASKQEASQELDHLLIEGQRMASVLRGGLKAHYGIRAEKLAEFGVQPFRGRRRAKPAEVPVPEPPPPTVELHV